MYGLTLITTSALGNRWATKTRKDLVLPKTHLLLGVRDP